MSFGSITGQGMPPYSTDPELSWSRHQDPNYVNSSDPPMPLSSDMMSVDGAIPSSPPGDIKLDTNHDQSGNSSEFHGFSHHYDDLNDVTDDDDAIDNDDNTLNMSNNRGAPAGVNVLQPLFNDPSFFSSNLSSQRSSSRPPIFAGAESTLKDSAPLAIRARSGSSFMPAAASRTESIRQTRAERAIVRVFDGNENVINLDNVGYDLVPEACRALADHEDLGRRLFILSISGNNIQLVDRFLYRIDRLKYLNLRNNAITELTAMVSQLVELNELHLGHNRLQTLPAELLTLPKLTTVTTYPNDFLDAPPEHAANVKLIRYCQQPSLVELTQRCIAQAGFTQKFPDFKRMLFLWTTELPQLLEPVLHAVQIGAICSVCRQPLVRPLAVYLNWKRHPADLSGVIVPYQTVFCTDKCLRDFETHAVL